MIVVTCSAKHAPGATTLALALTCALSTGANEAPPLLIETDAGGGDLAARLGLPTDPGLASLAAASRHGGDDGAIWRHANVLPGGGAVVLAPTDPGQCVSCSRTMGPRLTTLLEQTGVDAVIDAGRMPDASAMPALGREDWILVACRPDLAGIEHTRRLAADIRTARQSVNLGVVTVGDRPYGPTDVTAAMDPTVAFAVPIDPVGVATLLTGPERRARRTSLVRAVRSLLDQLPTGVSA